MKRTTARVAATVAGIGALTGLAVGAAHADESATEGYGSAGSATEQVQGSDSDEGSDQAAEGSDQATDEGSDQAAEEATAGSGGAAPNYVLQGAPGLPIGDPVSNVFSVSAPAYGVLGALG